MNTISLSSRPALDASVPAGGRSLIKTSAVGLVWVLAQTGSARLIGFLGQMVLARLLQPKDFGDIALATSVAIVISVLVGFGIDDVLLSRGRRFRMWTAPAMLVSLLLSAIGAAVMLGLAPFAAHLYHSRDVRGLLFVLAASLPLGALSAVSGASLRSEMRFGFVARYATAEILGIQLLTIALAWRGFGAYSFAIPVPIAAAVKSLVFWRATELHLKWHVRRSQLKLLLQNGGAVFGQKFMVSLRSNGDYMLLGAFASHAAVGLYYMAFRLAALPVYSAASSLAAVLFPALARLRGDESRQRRMVLSASRVIALIVIPLSFLQAAISRPLLHFFFGDRWTASSSLLSFLSIGVAFDAVPCAAAAVMSANGRFRQLLNYMVVTTPIFFVCIAVGCAFHGAEGVAIAVALYYIVTSPIFCYMALRPHGATTWDIAGIYLPPTVCAAIAAMLGMFVSKLAQTPHRDLEIIAVVCLVGTAAYALLVRFFAPATAKDTMQKVFLLCGRTA